MTVNSSTTFSSLFDTTKPPDSLISQKFYVVDGIKFSVLQSEEHSRKGQLTRHPMERGVQVSDHFIQEPETINARFEQTNVMYAADNPFAGKTTQELLESGNWNFADDYCKQVWADLTKLYDTRSVFNLITFHETYEDVLVTSISGLHRAPYKGALQFNVTFQKVHFVDIQVVTRGNSENETLQDKIDRGTQKAREFDTLSEVTA